MFIPKDPDWANAVRKLRDSGVNIMGDRFYTQQLEGKRTPDGKKKAPRKLKADWINEINAILPNPVEGLNKLTVDSLVELHSNIEELASA